MVLKSKTTDYKQSPAQTINDADKKMKKLWCVCSKKPGTHGTLHPINNSEHSHHAPWDLL